jgi:hypothetical protein
VILSWSLDPPEQPAFTPIFLFEVLVYGDWITFYLPFVKHIIKDCPLRFTAIKETGCNPNAQSARLGHARANRRYKTPLAYYDAFSKLEARKQNRNIALARTPMRPLKEAKDRSVAVHLRGFRLPSP